MRRCVVIVAIGTLLCWSGFAYPDPGGPHLLDKANVLNMKLGLVGGIVSRIDVSMAGNAMRYDFSPWNGQQGKNNTLTSLGCISDDRDRPISQIDSRGLAFPAGIGWGNPLGEEQKWEFALDMGVVLQIPPEVAMTAAGRLVLNAPFEGALIHGEKQLGAQWDDFGYTPVVTFGFRYRF